MLAFHAYINKMEGSRGKNLSKKKILSGSVAQRDLILALKG
jgi:hypothetical protein